MGKKKKKLNLLREVKQLEESQQDRQSMIKEMREASFRRFEAEAARDGSTSMRVKPGQLKMSAVMHHFLTPFVPEPRALEDYEDVLPLAIVAWNTATLPPEEHIDELNEFCQFAFPECDPFELYEVQKILKEMLDYKLEYFGEIDRIIADYDVYDVHGEIRLSIASRLAD